MPKVRIINPKMNFVSRGVRYEGTDSVTGLRKIYDVTPEIAHFLCEYKKIAEEVDESGKKIEASVAEKEAIIRTPVNPTRPPKPGDLKIAMIRLGGIGDSIVLGIQARAVKRKYPKSYIVLFVRDRVSAQFLVDLGLADHAISCGDKNWTGTTEMVLQQGYDIVYDNKYVTQVHYGSVKPFEKDKQETDAAFKKYEKYFRNFPHNCNKLTSENPLISEYEIMCKSACLELKLEDMQLQLMPEDYNMADLIAQDKYITIHNGSDYHRQTKCWNTEKWAVVAKEMKKLGYKVIQLGKRLEEPVEGAIDMLGKCTLRQSAAILAKAQFHIDTEGGLVHIARMVGTRSIVLFGPTPEPYFGYSENWFIISNQKCIGCWWSSDFWWRDCPKGFESPPPCMDSIAAGDVVSTAKNFIKEHSKKDTFRIFKEIKAVKSADEQFYEQWAREMPLNEGHYKAEQWQWDRIYTMMDMVVGKDVLEIGAGDGYCAKILQSRGFNVTATEFSQVRISRMKADGINAIFADVNCLPFEDNSFDTVIAGEILEHIPSMAKGLAEIERVVKPDGKIVISLPISKLHWEFKGHLWGLTHKTIMRDKKPDMIVMSMEQINRE